MTLNQIWDAPGRPADEGRIVFIYEDAAHDDPAEDFPNIKESWGNVQSPEELQAYLRQETDNARDDVTGRYHPWRPNCQLTPDAESVVGQE